VGEVSRIIAVPGVNGAQYAAIERDDGTCVFASDYVSCDRGSEEIVIDGTRCVFIRKSDFAAELAASGLQPIWIGESRE
jgi:hypothetical protein